VEKPEHPARQVGGVQDGHAQNLLQEPDRLRPDGQFET
jgi:hypothetical protein